MATEVFTENHDLITVPLVAKIGKRNIISDQLMDCYVSVVMYYDIAIHQLVQNYVKKLKFKRSNGHLYWDAVEAWYNNFYQI